MPARIWGGRAQCRLAAALMQRSALSPQATGIAIFVLAIFTMSIMDVIAKAASQRVDVVQVLWARYAGQTLIVFLIVSPRLRSALRTAYPMLQLARSLLLLTATTCFFFAISRLPLADATALMYVNPVLITLGAALFLGERLGMRRALGVGAAMLGALIIIRPGSAVFSASALLPLGGAVAYSGYALITRFVGRGESVWTSLLYTATAGAVVLSLIVPGHWQTPDGTTLALLLAIGLVGATGQLFMIRGLMLAEASAVAPFSYAALIFASFWGVALFGEYPDSATVIGALVIAGAGIYVWHRETRRTAVRG